jgi:hypothetical protein
MWKEAAVASLDLSSQHCLEGLKKSTKASVMTASLWTNIWNWDLSIISQDANHLAVMLV